MSREQNRGKRRNYEGRNESLPRENREKEIVKENYKGLKEGMEKGEGDDRRQEESTGKKEIS